MSEEENEKTLIAVCTQCREQYEISPKFEERLYLWSLGIRCPLCSCTEFRLYFKI